MDSEILVEVKEVSRYYGQIAALESISFTMNKGEVLGFLGPNGAGKTTTMQVITGNLAPTSGSVRVADHDLLEDPRAAKKAIGYLPEQPPVYKELTVDEYLDYCAALNRISRDKRTAARDAAKEKCGLTEVGRRLIGHLSKGYQQRVGLAQAIIHMPPVVILDEPTVGLDPIQIREIRKLIRDLGKTHSVILSTHILPEVQATCDRVQIINKGEIIMTDSIDGLQEQLKSSSITVAFQQAPDLDKLKNLPSINAVEEASPGFWRLLFKPDQDPTDEVVKLSVANNWGLRELRPGRVSLEEVFVHLTTSDHEHSDKDAGTTPGQEK
jgi:ABC-2 type transport system ATP-binding protein